MKRQSVRNPVLALLGLAALVVYVLACASFSPDDKTVLYPAFDAPSGDLAVAAYDRAAGTSETVFIPRFYTGTGEAKPEPRLLRPQWLPDGKGILVAWPGGDDDKDQDGLNLAVVPFGGKGPTKLFFLPGFHDSMARLLAPLAVAGSRVFMSGESNLVARLDLVTGALATHQTPVQMNFYADATGERIFYLGEVPGETNTYQLGQLDPETFAEKPLTRFAAGELGEMGFLVFSRDGSRIALTQETNGATRLLILGGGQPERMPELAAKDERLSFGNAVFSPKGDTLYASFLRTTEGETNASLGFMEIPLGTGKVRRTTLFRSSESIDRQSAAYFQIGLSNDGKTLAAASTYFAVDDPKPKLKPEDCALFLVDLTDPERKVKRVPIPRPAVPQTKP